MGAEEKPLRRPALRNQQPVSEPTAMRSRRYPLLIVLLCAAAAPRTAIAGSPKLGWAGGDAGDINASNASWYYRWWHDIPPSADGALAQFVPLIKYPANLQSKLNSINGIPNVDTVLVLNEPERADQSNVTVTEAIDLWPQVQNSLADKRLISPGVSDDAAGRAWLDEFFQQVDASKSNADPLDDLRVDAVAFHWYGASSPNAVSAANNFLSRVDYFHQRYNLPVWITEFTIHDWAGNYTDEQILNANAQFLDIVIPALESRSYVERYAYYSFLSDATAFSGTPITPTVVGDAYAGTLMPGETRDLVGAGPGTDVVYLRGGALRNTGGAAPGAVRAIDALQGVSTIAADGDWSLANLRSSFVNVRDGATLLKTGAAAVDLYGPVTVEGTLQIEEGTLRIIDGVFSGAQGATVVGAGATLGLSLQGGRGTHSFSDHDLSVAGTVEGPLRLVAGSTLNTSGDAATFTSNLTLNASILEVGGAGLQSGPPTVQPVAAGLKLNYVAGLDTPGDNVWSDAVGSTNGFTFAQPVSPLSVSDPTFPGITAAYPIGVTGGAQGLNQYFETDGPRSRQDASFEVVFRVDNPAAGTDQVLLEVGGAASGVALVLNNNELLFNVDGVGGDIDLRSPLAAGWNQAVGVIDLDAGGDTVTLYLNGQVVGSLAIQNVVDWAGGNLAGLGAGASSVTGVSSTIGAAFHGDLAIARYYQNKALSALEVGQNFGSLTSPLGKIAGLLQVDGDLRLENGSELRIDVGDNGLTDKVSIGGSLAIVGGAIVIGYDGVLGLEAGAAFDLLDFASLQGAFSSMTLPELASGLMWNTDRLLSDGVVIVTLAGDYNGDGAINAADYTVWRDAQGSTVTAFTGADGDGDGVVTAADLNVWSSRYGELVVISATAVPEPGGLIAVCLSLLTYQLTSRQRRRQNNYWSL